MLVEFKLALLAAVCVVVKVEASQQVIGQLAINFAKPLEACRKEFDISDDAIKEFASFWTEGFELQNRQVGCAILCISSKLDLLDAEMNLHHGKAQEFAMKHGADEGMAKQLVDMIHNCDKSTPSSEDPCMKALNVAKCFKAEIHKLNWAPSPELLMGEVLAEG